jgi:hypothetical protein
MAQMTKNDASSPDDVASEFATVPGDSHVETTVSMMTGDTIRIFCDCALGHDHAYEEWVARFGPYRAVS